MAAALAVSLAGCDDMKQGTGDLADTTQSEGNATANKLREIAGFPVAPPRKLPAQASYCYKTFNDVLCYSHPLPGQEYRLVGYQEPTGKTGYTITPTQEETTEAPPQQRPLRAVTVSAPPAVKGTPGAVPPEPGSDAKPHLKEIIFDPADLDPKELVPDKPQ